MDSFYDFPSGHLEEGEPLQTGAARELLEETGLTVSPDELTLFHINQNNSDPEKPYINFMFLIREWKGKPRICEPEKCNHLNLFPLNALPETTLQVQATLAALQAKVPISFSNFEAGSIAGMLKL